MIQTLFKFRRELGFLALFLVFQNGSCLNLASNVEPLTAEEAIQSSSDSAVSTSTPEPAALAGMVSSKAIPEGEVVSLQITGGTAPYTVSEVITAITPVSAPAPSITSLVGTVGVLNPTQNEGTYIFVSSANFLLQNPSISNVTVSFIVVDDVGDTIPLQSAKLPSVMITGPESAIPLLITYTGSGSNVNASSYTFASNTLFPLSFMASGGEAPYTLILTSSSALNGSIGLLSGGICNPVSNSYTLPTGTTTFCYTYTASNFTNPFTVSILLKDATGSETSIILDIVAPPPLSAQIISPISGNNYVSSTNLLATAGSNANITVYGSNQIATSSSTTTSIYSNVSPSPSFSTLLSSMPYTSQPNTSESGIIAISIAGGTAPYTISCSVSSTNTAGNTTDLINYYDTIFFSSNSTHYDCATIVNSSNQYIAIPPYLLGTEVNGVYPNYLPQVFQWTVKDSAPSPNYAVGVVNVLRYDEPVNPIPTGTPFSQSAGDFTDTIASPTTFNTTYDPNNLINAATGAQTGFNLATNVNPKLFICILEYASEPFATTSGSWVGVVNGNAGTANINLIYNLSGQDTSNAYSDGYKISQVILYPYYSNCSSNPCTTPVGFPTSGTVTAYGPLLGASGVTVNFGTNISLSPPSTCASTNNSACGVTAITFSTPILATSIVIQPTSINAEDNNLDPILSGGSSPTYSAYFFELSGIKVQ